MTPWIQKNGSSYLAVADGNLFRLHDGSVVPVEGAVHDTDAEEGYETLKNSIPRLVAFFEGRRVTVKPNHIEYWPEGAVDPFEGTNGYEVWLGKIKLGESENALIALLSAGYHLCQESGFDGWSDDDRCIELMNSMDFAFIRAQNSRVTLLENSQKPPHAHFLTLNGSIMAWDNNPVVAMIGGLTV